MRGGARPYSVVFRDRCYVLLEDRGKVRGVIERTSSSRGCYRLAEHLGELAKGMVTIAWLWNGYTQPEAALQRMGFGRRRELRFTLWQGSEVEFWDVLCARASLFRGVRTAPKP